MSIIHPQKEVTGLGEELLWMRVVEEEMRRGKGNARANSQRQENKRTPDILVG